MSYIQSKITRYMITNTFLTRQIQLSYVPSTLVCQCLLVAQSTETSTTKSIFIWYRSQRDVHLFCKFRLTFKMNQKLRD